MLLQMLMPKVTFNPCFAQSNIVPDNTLGTEPSQLTPNINVDGIPSTLIEGGAERDQNLFHSLQELNVALQYLVC